MEWAKNKNYEEYYYNRIINRVCVVWESAE